MKNKKIILSIIASIILGCAPIYADQIDEAAQNTGIYEHISSYITWQNVRTIAPVAAVLCSGYCLYRAYKSAMNPASYLLDRFKDLVGQRKKAEEHVDNVAITVADQVELLKKSKKNVGKIKDNVQKARDNVQTLKLDQANEIARAANSSQRIINQALLSAKANMDRNIASLEMANAALAQFGILQDQSHLGNLQSVSFIQTNMNNQGHLLRQMQAGLNDMQNTIESAENAEDKKHNAYMEAIRNAKPLKENSLTGCGESVAHNYHQKEITVKN